MYSGHPFRIADVLPAWLPVENFYVGVTGAAAVVCVMAIISNFSPRGRMAAKVKIIQERRRELRGEATSPKKRRRPETSVNFMRAVAQRLQLVKNLQVGKAESTLIEAGYRSKDALYIMAFFVMMLPIVLGLLGVVATNIFPISEKWKLLKFTWPLLGAYIGIKLPWLVIGRSRTKRYHKIRKSLSDVLDLMTICAEAGLGLSAMLDRVSKELAISYPEMAEELGMTAVEIGFLPDRNKALLNLADRCKLPEVRGIVSVLIQTEKYGTPIAQALRVLSLEFRQARMLRAEQKAAQLPALMTIPMIIFILPTLFIVILSPAIVKLLDIMAAQ